MKRYIAFLRAINVGGRTVKMDKLTQLFESLGFTDVDTFLASGNVIFRSGEEAESQLQKEIEASLGKTLGFTVATFLRSDEEVAEVARYKPFRGTVLQSAQALNIGFLAAPLGRKDGKTLMQFKTTIDDFHIHGREIYWLCQKKQSESTFSNVSFEKALGIRATFRGINTIQKLAQKYPPLNGSS
ncbi:MAG: DUF1697 domain-containing protein [Bacteroidota bacterium]